MGVFTKIQKKLKSIYSNETSIFDNKDIKFIFQNYFYKNVVLYQESL